MVGEWQEEYKREEVRNNMNGKQIGRQNMNDRRVLDRWYENGRNNMNSRREVEI